MKPTRKQGNSRSRRQNSKPTFNKDASPFSPTGSSIPNHKSSDPADLTYPSSTQQLDFTPNHIVRKSTTAASPTDFNATPVPYIVIFTNIPNHVSKNALIQLINYRTGINQDSYTIDQVFPEHDNTMTAILKVPDLATCNKIVATLNNTEWQGKILNVSLNMDDSEQLDSITNEQQQQGQTNNLHSHNNYISSNYNFGRPLTSSSSSSSSLSENYWRPSVSRNISASSNASLFSLSNRSSSLDSRKPFSRKTSKSSMSSMGMSSQRNSESSSISSDPQASRKPVPPFIISMIQGNDEATAEGHNIREEDETEAHETQSVQEKPFPQVQEIEQDSDDGKSHENAKHEHEHEQEHEQEQSQVKDDEEEDDDEEIIWVPAPIDGNTNGINEEELSNTLIKVNARRLYVGNIPYSSNWTSVKNFLINKSNEWEPNNNINILRVEIPVHLTSRSDSYYMYPSNRGYSTTPKSRGFAIVTTGDRHSSEKLIELFNDIQFEGRSLTVRYDKHPDCNNYVMQQMHTPSRGNYHNHFHEELVPLNQQPIMPFLPQYVSSPSSNKPSNYPNLSSSTSSSSSMHPGSNYSNSPSLISSLAFERNSYQRNFYYAATTVSGTVGNLLIPNTNSNQNPNHSQIHNQSGFQPQPAQQIPGAPVPHLLSPSINQFIQPPPGGGYIQYQPSRQSPQQHSQGPQPFQFLPPLAPHSHPHLPQGGGASASASASAAGGAAGGGSPNSQPYMYWTHPYYSPGPIYALPPQFQQYPYAGSPHHYQQFSQHMNNQGQYFQPPAPNQHEQREASTLSSKDDTQMPARGIKEITSPTQGTNTLKDTMSEEEKARDLINSIKDLSIDK